MSSRYETEAEFIHELLNKLTVLDGKLRKVSRLNQDSELADELSRTREVSARICEMAKIRKSQVQSTT